MAVLGAAIPAVGSILGGIFGKNSSKKAQKAQTQAINAAIGEQRRQYDQTRADNLPFLNAGTGALGATQGLLGLQGNDVQQKAIEALRASPAFTSLYDVGQDTILQNAAATGGLRGGNTQNSLAQFGSSLLGTVIQNQLSNLGGLVNIGAGTAGQLGALGQNSANSISNLLTQQGNAQASGILGRGAILNNTINDISGLFQGLGQKKWGW